MPILDEVRITELPGADPLAGLELIPLVQSGVTKTRSAQNLVLEGGLQDHLDDADPHGQYAELSGGASANFASMPQVGGDPIVESGSNADGEWTRWSDGTQICYKTDATFTVISGGGRMEAPDWDYPSAFSATPAFTINLFPGVGTGSGAWNNAYRSQAKVSFVGARDSGFVKAVQLRIYAIAGESFVESDFVDNNSLTAVGRWQ